jgi:hypothetical protein
MPSILSFTFGKGLGEDTDNRLQEPGTPREVRNLVRTKNGRLEMRRDYDVIANTLPPAAFAGGGTGLELFGLQSFGDRLIGLGDSLHSDEPAKAANACVKAFALVERPDFNWAASLQPFLSCVTHMRDVDGLVTIPNGMTRMDTAAGGGLCCNVYEIVLGPSTYVTIHIFDPVTGATILETETGSNVNSRPRVCFVGGNFLITQIVNATNAIALNVFTVATGVFAGATDPVAAGASIVAYDLSAAHEATSAWIAVARSDTTTALRGLSTAGAVTYTTAGPAVLADAISIIAHSLVAATLRIHVVIVRDTTLNIDVHSYTPPTTTPYLSSLDLMTTRNATTQVGLAVCEVGGGATVQFLAVWNDGADIFWRKVNCVTHAITSEGTRANFRINSKPVTRNGIIVCGFTVFEGAAALTSCLLEFQRISTFAGTTRPATVVDRLVAANVDVTHLPSIGKDTSTLFLYWIRPTDKGGSPAQPRTTEFLLGSTDRRSCAQLGNILYISGGVVMAHDGRGVGEAGGFLIRPVIMSSTEGTIGALTLLGTYQMSAKYELVDPLGNVLQSAPSDVFEITLTGANDSLFTTVSGPLSFINNLGGTVTFPLYGRILYQIYRTLNTNDGNITLHFDTQGFSSQAYESAEIQIQNLLSDVAISDEEVLYSQGARGALSGPLEFITPDPCTVLAAGSDRVLSGGLPRDSSIQESRPQFVGEQAQWSDSIGFYRDAHGRMLAVSRLDERRLLFTRNEIFEVDGPGLDDNGLGEIGPPRRLPSDVGIYGGNLGWRSLVEMSAGIMFQGLADQIYLLPRGGITPVAIGGAVEDTLAAYPTIVAGVYMQEDQTVRFCCNNLAGTESVILLFDVRFGEWFVEGPYPTTFRAAAKANGRFYTLDALNVVRRQRTTQPPASFLAGAWRSGVIHPWKPGMFGRVYAVWFYGTFRGACRIRCIINYYSDGAASTETHEWIDVAGLVVGELFVFRFEFDQVKCESCTVDFETAAFQGQTTAGLDFNFWQIEQDPSDVPNQVGPERMT